VDLHAFIRSRMRCIHVAERPLLAPSDHIHGLVIPGCYRTSAVADVRIPLATLPRKRRRVARGRVNPRSEVAGPRIHGPRSMVMDSGLAG
jgi:hypothetical protein